MSAANLHLWALWALVLFVAVFVGVVIYAYGGKRREQWRLAGQMPLDDEAVRMPRDARAETTGGMR
jgi:cbb3-type cytochrome oxidase subunit 3